MVAIDFISEAIDSDSATRWWFTVHSLTASLFFRRPLLSPKPLSVRERSASDSSISFLNGSCLSLGFKTSSDLVSHSQRFVHSSTSMAIRGVDFKCRQQMNHSGGADSRRRKTTLYRRQTHRLPSSPLQHWKLHDRSLRGLCSEARRRALAAVLQRSFMGWNGFVLNPRQQHLWLEILLKLSSQVQRLQQLWEEKLLNNPHEHQYPKKRSRLFWLYDVRLLYGKWLACGIISSYHQPLQVLM